MSSGYKPGQFRGARRCSPCGISYPKDNEYAECPVCHQQTTYILGGEPDDDWNWKATALQQGVKAPQISTDDYILVVPSVVPVTKADGRYWIHYWDLYDVGVIDRLPTDLLIKVGEQCFEIIYWVDCRRSYLVRPFSLSLSPKELLKLSGQRGRLKRNFVLKENPKHGG